MKIFPLLTILIVVYLPFVYSYEVNPLNNATVHQYITNESILIWKLIPFEIKNHAKNPITNELDSNYDVGNDIVSGSGEEDRQPDTVSAAFTNHFWQPDDPDTLTNGTGDYNDGLAFGDSSFFKAKNIWLMEVIPNYLKGNINESYYHLGRVAHLLEDASQPSHVHLDPHLGHPLGCVGNLDCDDSFLEEFTAQQNYFADTQNRMNVEHYAGETYENKTYKYENLISGFNWSNVDATYPDSYGSIIPLFRLMWYTAQKTQYYASDDNDENSVYYDLDGVQHNFPSSLWQGDGVTIVSDNAAFENEDYYFSANNEGSTCTAQGFDVCPGPTCYLCNNNTGPDIEKETNATIPHSMKSVAGLYRLFWDAVQIDWKFNHHDVRNTGYTLLKGDITANSKNKAWNYSSAPSTDFWDETAIAEIDNDVDDGQEIIVATSNSDYTDGRVYALDGDTNNVLWSNDEPTASEPPSVDDVDGDGTKEVIVGSHDLYLYNINSKNGTKNWRYLINNQTGVIGPYRSTIFDINNDGSKEIVFGEAGQTGAYNGHVVALNSNGNQVWNSSSTEVQGFQNLPAIADLNGDGYPEVVITGNGMVVVYNGTNGVELWRKHMANTYANPVVADLDNDNDYEVIVGNFEVVKNGF